MIGLQESSRARFPRSGQAPAKAPVASRRVVMQAEELEQQLKQTCLDLLEECGAQAKSAREYAERENAYRMAKAQAFIKAEGKTVDAKKAEVDIICERERLAAHIAEGLLDATRERVRSLRATLSALQTIVGMYKAEADFARTGPNY